VLLLDNSAWSRLVQGALDEKLNAKIAAWIEQRELATCLPFLLEAGYSARSPSDHQAKMADLDLLPSIRVTPAIEEVALAAQSELASVGHHRLTPIDIVIAACAHEAGAGVLHYDRDYDILAEHTSLEFESEWIAPPGTL
jgi:predicted nucleic acid-binding protein